MHPRPEGPHRSKLLLSLVTLLVTLTVASSVWAQPISAKKRWTARKLGGEAMDLYDAGDYDAALEKFQAADDLVAAPTIKLRMARCLDKLDRLIEAGATYRKVIETELDRHAPAVHRKARKDAVPELAALNKQIPAVLVLVKGPGADETVVSLDGEPFPNELIGKRHQLDPGSYVFEAEREADGATVKLRVTLARSQHEEVVLRLPELGEEGDATRPQPKPAKPEDGSAYRLGGWIALGIGGAGLVVGSVVGIVVLGDESSLEERCPDRQCPPEAHDDAEQFDTLRTTSTVGLILGAVGVAAGVTLLLVAPDGDADEQPADPDDELGVDSLAIAPCERALGVCLSGTFF